ncbi:MAG: hypothetical protein CL537_17040 [Alcanivoracaceae bacterium]|nr:hypothetical protein [Alcanivoracaceae bacterium]|tara:strand:- start:7292 stop:8014 length:723 start_codon:yes stop_codon:yes gene_type:complete
MKADFTSPYNESLVSGLDGFRKRKYSLGWAVRDAISVFARLKDIHAIAVKNRLPEDFREEIMVAVSRANGCTICNFTHHEFAQHAGVSEETLRQLEQADYHDFDPHRKIAIDYAVARSLSDFGPVDPELNERFVQEFTDQEQYDIDFVARFITIMNLSCNKLEAFYHRLNGDPAKDSSIFGELVISGVAMTIIPVMYSLVAVAQKQRLSRVVKDFFEFAEHYEAVVQPLLIDNNKESHHA